MPLKDELVPKPRLKLPNVSSEIVDNNIFRESLEILLPAAAIAVKQLRKISSRGEDTMPLKDELVPKPRRKTP